MPKYLILFLSVISVIFISLISYVSRDTDKMVVRLLEENKKVKECVLLGVDASTCSFAIRNGLEPRLIKEAQK